MKCINFFSTQTARRSLAMLIVSIFSMALFAHDFEKDDIYYGIISEADKEVAVTYRGKYSSSYDEYFGSLNIPQTVDYGGITYSVTSIGSSAFSGCSGLKSVTIPNSVTSIDNYAFYGCRGLTSVTIPNSVTSIGENAFGSCYLDVINMFPTIPPLLMSPINVSEIIVPKGSIANYINADNWNQIHSIYAIKNDEKYVGISFLEEGESVASLMNYSGGIMEVSVNSTQVVNAVNDNYKNCIMYQGNKNVTLEFIDNGSFSFSPSPKWKNNIIKTNSYPTTIVEVTAPGTLIDHIGIDNLENILYLRVSGDINGTDILTIRKMNNLLFLDMSEANIVNGGQSYYKDYTTSKDKVGEYFFADRNVLKIVFLPNSITTIAEKAFSNCTGLTSVTIPNSVTSIGYRAFDGCTGLTSITIPNSVTSIDNNAFLGCTGLTSITIPNSVTSIGEEAFSGCTGLTSVNIEDGTKKLSFGVTRLKITDTPIRFVCKSFRGCNLETLYLGRNISNPSLGSDITQPSPFQGNGKLTSVTIGKDVTSIGEEAFSGCTGLTSITIPNSVISIGEEAFSGCTGLTSITIPNSVTSIGHRAFDGCTGLTSVTIEDGTKKLSLSNSFYKCNFETLYLGRNISDNVFNRNGKLTSVTIGKDVTSIGEEAFSNCTGLTSVTIPNSVTSIGYRAFSGCTGLTSITIPNSVTSIDNYAFLGCTGLTSITIPSSVTSIGNYTFYHCTGLTSITIPSSVTSIGNYTFSGCTGLTSVTIPNSVTSIGKEAFSGCTGLTSVTIPNSITTIAEKAFSNCTGLTSVTIPNSVTSIGYRAFDGCTGLTSITIPNSVTSIDNNAFLGCTGLTSITIPNSVTSIGEEAFSGCTGLTFVNIEDGTSELKLGYYLFKDCNFETLYLGRNISKPFLGSNITQPSPFQGNGKLTSVTIGKNVTSIGSDAFYNCSGLISVTSLNPIPPVIYQSTFDEETEKRAVLNVPIRSKTLYWLHPYWENFLNIGDGIEIYILTYMVDGETYKTVSLQEGYAITPEPEPTRDGYAFSGWSEIPSTMPAHDVTVNGYFTEVVHEYTLTYMVDGETYKTVSLLEGDAITPEPEPTREGYAFSGWSEIPSTMPAHDVTVTGSFIINSPTNNEEWKDVTIDFDKSVPFTKIRVLNTKAASSGIYCCVFFSINPNDDTNEDTKYNINFNRQTIGDGVNQDDSRGYIYVNTCKSVGDGWYEYEFQQPVYFSHYQKNAMKDCLKVYIANEATPSGTGGVIANKKSFQIYTPDGKSIDTLQKGINIIRYSDGSMKKIHNPF